MEALEIVLRLRRATTDELSWFELEPHIAGYAAADGTIVLNPRSGLQEIERACVVRNEAMRLLMAALSLSPDVDVTDAQAKAFAGTEYANNPVALRQTIVARLASGDPSAGQGTELQIGYARAVCALFEQVVQLECDEDADRALVHLATNLRVRPRAQADG